MQQIVFDSHAADSYSITASDIASAFDVRYSNEVLGMVETDGGTMT